MKKSFNSNAAGIDISSREHVVAVPEDRDNQSVKKYSTFTADLRRLILWLKKCKIDTVAMESTGVYWYHLYTMLLDTDIEVEATLKTPIQIHLINFILLIINE